MITRTKRILTIVLGTLLAAFLFFPELANAWTLLNNRNSVNFRDVRVNPGQFRDPTAHQNTQPHANWPGAFGVGLAMWKGAAEWNAAPHGDGTGDPSQPTVGDGGANYDWVWLGNTTANPAGNRVVGASSTSLGLGVLAATFIPVGSNDTWHILFDDPQWVWDDGPGSPAGNAIDLQGVGCHEFGHALGLGHSLNTNSTMYPYVTFSGVGERSIELDDQQGIQAAYGVAGTGKPRITGLTGGNSVGSTITITGVNFPATALEVWFTPAAAASAPIKVQNLASTSGGTQVQVVVPAGAGSGEVHVYDGSGTGGGLSNSWPIALGSAACQPYVGGRPKLCSITPNTFSNYDPNPQPMVIDGYGFYNGVTSLTIGSTTLSVFTNQFQILTDRQIRLDFPPVTDCGTVDVTLIGNYGPSNVETIIVTSEVTPWIRGEVTAMAGVQYELVIGGNQGSIQVPFLSPFGTPTVIGNLVTLDIGGNNFLLLVPWPALVMNACGTGSYRFDPGAPGITGTFYWQSVEIPPTLQPTPFAKSNVHALYKAY
ncbi:MAG: matrixin family metalloprotease [Planctomycetes bacterium]|nr:matrixin family metalloprotease [Planctomycetota bacterium]MCB9891740.1 matrixin family metalloprotease [Planctomycetota bacterium]